MPGESEQSENGGVDDKSDFPTKFDKTDFPMKLDYSLFLKTNSLGLSHRGD